MSNKYTIEEIEKKLKAYNDHPSKLFLSEQYGMWFLLTEDNQILLKINKLIKK